MDKNNITIHIGHVLFLSFSVLFSESVELSISSLPHCLSFYFHNSYHQINQALVSRDSYMRGINYYHPKKERLDINTKFGWCCGGLVVVTWCQWRSVDLVCYFASALVWFGLVCFRYRLPNPAHSYLVCQVFLFLFFFPFYYLCLAACYENCVCVLLLLPPRLVSVIPGKKI